MKKTLAVLAVAGVLGLAGTALADVNINVNIDDLPKFAARTQTQTPQLPPKMDNQNRPPMPPKGQFSNDKRPPMPPKGQFSGDKRPPMPPKGAHSPDKRPPMPPKGK